MNAYSYSHNNPVTKSDPDGTRPLGPTDGGTTTDNQWANDRGMKRRLRLQDGKWVWGQSPKKDSASRQKYAAYQANPTHYMIDDGYAAARARQQGRRRRQKSKAQAAARAQEDRRGEAPKEGRNFRQHHEGPLQRCLGEHQGFRCRSRSRSGI